MGSVLLVVVQATTLLKGSALLRAVLALNVPQDGMDTTKNPRVPTATGPASGRYYSTYQPVP